MSSALEPTNPSPQTNAPRNFLQSSPNPDGLIQIFINYSDKTYTLDVNPEDTIKILKEKIQKKLKIQNFAQHYFLHQSFRNEFDTIAEYDLKTGITLFLGKITPGGGMDPLLGPGVNNKKNIPFDRNDLLLKDVQSGLNIGCQCTNVACSIYEKKTVIVKNFIDFDAHQFFHHLKCQCCGELIDVTILFYDCAFKIEGEVAKGSSEVPFVIEWEETQNNQIITFDKELLNFNFLRIRTKSKSIPNTRSQEPLLPRQLPRRRAEVLQAPPPQRPAEVLQAPPPLRQAEALQTPPPQRPAEVPEVPPHIRRAELLRDLQNFQQRFRVNRQNQTVTNKTLEQAKHILSNPSFFYMARETVKSGSPAPLWAKTIGWGYIAWRSVTIGQDIYNQITGQR